MSTTWIAAGVVTAIAHIGFAALVETAEHHPKPLPPIEMTLATLPPVAKDFAPPPPPLPPPPTQPPKLVKRITPIAPPPPPETKRVGISEDSTTPKGEVAVATGVTADGVIGTGTSMDKDSPPPPPGPLPPAPPPPRAPKPVPPNVFPSFEVTRLPKPKHHVQPEIPAAFRDAQREALVVIEVVIDARGKVVDARVLRHADYGLDDAALAAARQTEFEPALVGTQPVSVRYQIPYRFTVRG